MTDAVPSPALTRDSDARICRRYFTGTVTLCKVHGHPSARCEDWEAGYRFARAGDKAEAPPIPPITSASEDPIP